MFVIPMLKLFARLNL